VRNKEDERQVRITLMAEGTALRNKVAKIPAAIGCIAEGAVRDIDKLHGEIVALREALNASVVSGEESGR